MDLYNEETEFNVTHIPMFQRVVDMFEGRPQFQRIVRLGILANMGYTDELDVSSEDDYEFDQWVHGPSNSRRYPRPSDRNNDRGLSGNYTGSPSSADRLPLTYYTAASDRLPPLSVKVQAKESDTERRARLLQEAKKSKEKAEKKRIKKQKQKQRKQLEKLEKEKQNPAKNEEEKDEKKQSQADESKPVNDKPNSSVTNVASARDTDSSNSSEDESSDEDSDTKNDSGDSEELDMTSTFVSKAAHKARQKLEQNSRTEKKEKKKTPVKEEPKPVSDKRNEQVEGNKDTELEKKDPASPRCPTFEDNVKMSTDLANIGNKFASAGDFNMAVKYFTDAIKYNPTEFKLFGNRSFCFEKMQEYMKALTDAELSLSMCPGWVKGLFRKGRALAGLKRYEEAAEAFREVLKLESSCAEAAHELMRVQMTQLMGYGFTREQSSNALIIHGTVEKALEVLSQLHTHPGAVNNKSSLRLAQVANVSGVSPVLSANTSPVPPQSQNAPTTPLKYKPLGPVQNMSNLKSQPQCGPNQAVKTSSEDGHPRQELFPVWVGNLFFPVTETLLANLFNKAGNVSSVKVLTYKRCAFVNFTKQEHCEEAIRRFHGFDLNGVKIAVRYPDRIPKGMGISKSALKAEDLQDENMGHFDHGSGRYPVGRRPALPYRPPPDHRGNYKH